jgi:sialate O-acetylesterase
MKHWPTGFVVPPLAVAMMLALLLQQSLPTQADVVLGTLFRDGVMLQRDKPVAVWGSADPNEPIEVRFAEQRKRCTADAQGRWLVYLDPLKASADPAELVVRGKNKVTVKDVLVGDVWLCSGQSNMNLPVTATENAAHEIAQADHPLIRYFEVRSSILDEPTDFAEGEWQVCSPETVGTFTAVGYYFAEAIQPELGVPVGIIKATLGGSPIEGWMSAEALASTPASAAAFSKWKGLSPGYEKRAQEYREALAKWKSLAAAATADGNRSTKATKPVRAWVDSDRNKPSGLYNGFIYPLQPGTLAGVLWYQGEGNVPRPDDYKVLFPLMIQQWRRDFRQESLPFLFAQLSSYEPKDDPSGQTWARLREAQAFARTLPNVGMAVTTDIGDPADIHPRNKQEVGKRLARLALRTIYGRDVVDSGPEPIEVMKEGSMLRIRFANATGLTFRGDADQAFVIAGADGRFQRASARIDGDSVCLTAHDVLRPVAARLNWENCAHSVLVNSSGLPAAPFRTDNW